METLERVLLEHPFMKELSEEHVRFLVGCAKNVRFEPGQYLIREGEDEGTFYLVREGTVSLEAHVPGKSPATVETLGSGDVLGVSWMFPGTKASIDARARDLVLAFALDGACMRAKADADHDLGLALARRLLHLTYRRLQRLRLQKLDVYG